MRIAAIAMVLCASTSVRADEDPFDLRDPRGTRSATLFTRARQDLAAGNFDKACDGFQRSLELERAAGTELNLGACEERRGHLAEAWRLFTDAAAQLDRDDDTPDKRRARFAHTRADALSPKLATVRVHLKGGVDPDLVLTIADRKVKISNDIVERVDPGQVRIIARPSYQPPIEQVVSPESGQSVTVDLDTPPPAPARLELHARTSWRVANAIMLLGTLACAIASGNTKGDTAAEFAATGVLLGVSTVITFAITPDDPNRPVATGIAIAGRF
jgi:hypothetical protein